MANALTDIAPDVPWLRWPGSIEPPATAVIRYFITPSDQPFLTNLLLPTEQQRANRFRQLADRQRFVAGRGWLRWLAGQLTGTLPKQVQLAVGPFGKPELINPREGAGNWHVNVSHAGDWVLLAFGPTPVGVDVEWINPNWPYQDLIPSTFAADDQAQLADSLDARMLFYTFWTRKESLFKATGQGLTDDFMAVSSSKGRYQFVHGDATETGTWQAMSFSVAAGYVGAVACREPLPPVHFFTIDTASIGPTA